jgi:hypothetical protein
MKLGRGVISSALVLAGALTTGCASSSPPAPAGTKTAAEVVPAIKAAMRTASSVHVDGTVTDGSEKVIINESINGSNATGLFHANGITTVLLVADGKVYLQINPDYLKLANLPAAVCSTVCGKYVQIPASAFTQFTASTRLSHWTNAILSGMPSAAAGSTDLFKPATFQGQPVLRLRQAAQTVDVARTGAPYPLFISSRTYGSVTFSEWNSVPPVASPPPSQIVTQGSL